MDDGRVTRTKVVHLSSVHSPADTRIAVKECGALADAGFDVVIVCPQVSQAPLPERTTRLVRPSRGRIARVTVTVWRVLRAALRERAALYHLHDPELLPIVPLLRLTGAQVVYDVHEDNPQAALDKNWIPRGLRMPLSVMTALAEAVASRMVTGVVAATPQIGRRFPPSRTVVVQNFSVVDELKLARPTPYATREPLFAYIGATGVTRGSQIMVEAIRMVPANMGARLLMAGPTPPDELAAIDRLPGWPLVEHHQWQTRPEVARHLDRARAGMAVLHPTGNYVESYPVKVFEYMAAGLPIIASNFKLWQELFGDVKCALFVDPLDPGAVAAAMQWTLDNPEEAERMGERGRAVVHERFNWTAEAGKLVAFYNRLIPGAGSR
jgi:glycosyltransferase involved in cell wall biosynthesis